jgi:hypothetical protein
VDRFSKEQQSARDACFPRVDDDIAQFDFFADSPRHTHSLTVVSDIEKELQTLLRTTPKRIAEIASDTSDRAFRIRETRERKDTSHHVVLSLPDLDCSSQRFFVQPSTRPLLEQRWTVAGQCRHRSTCGHNLGRADLCLSPPLANNPPPTDISEV